MFKRGFIPEFTCFCQAKYGFRPPLHRMVNASLLLIFSVTLATYVNPTDSYEAALNRQSKIVLARSNEAANHLTIPWESINTIYGMGEKKKQLLTTIDGRKMTTRVEYQLLHQYHPGTLGRIAELHGTYYHEHWGFGLFFEAKVATELSAFLKRFDDHRDGIWLATVNNRVEGSIIIDGMDAANTGAHLRWFIVSDVLRNSGVGRMLINQAVKFCADKGYSKTYLWTFKGLDAARHLYEKAGFKLNIEQRGVQWGREVTEQYFELNIPDIQ